MFVNPFLIRFVRFNWSHRLYRPKHLLISLNVWRVLSFSMKNSFWKAFLFYFYQMGRSDLIRGFRKEGWERLINLEHSDWYKVGDLAIHSQGCVQAGRAGRGKAEVGGGHICGGSQMSNLIREVVQNISNELETMCNSPGSKLFCTHSESGPVARWVFREIRNTGVNRSQGEPR